jgi:hypothetical protein
VATTSANTAKRDSSIHPPDFGISGSFLQSLRSGAGGGGLIALPEGNGAPALAPDLEAGTTARSVLLSKFVAESPARPMRSPQFRPLCYAPHFPSPSQLEQAVVRIYFVRAVDGRSSPGLRLVAPAALW